MFRNKFISISICLPTYNNESTIELCLKSIKSQIYPENLIEIIIIDGGSTDNTLKICQRFSPVILYNPFKIEEEARAIGIKKSRGEIVAFIDADNILDDEYFMQKMVEPFIYNQEVVFSEPKFYHCNKEDNIITRYTSLLGADDAIAVYLGMYERYCYFKSRWTDFPYETVYKNSTSEIIKLVNLEKMPPFGSNGCFIKKSALLNIKYEPFLHTDVIYRMLSRNNLFAKVETGLIHKQSGNLRDFLLKKIRRVKRNYRKLQRQYYFPIARKDLILIFLKTFLILPLIKDAILGYKKRKDLAWLIHPIIVTLTFFIYAYFLAFRKSQYAIR